MHQHTPAIRRPHKASSHAELWVRLEAFLSMRSPRTYETYKGIFREWVEFLGAPLGSSDAAARITAATDLHAMAYLKWLSTRPGEAPRISSSLRAKHSMALQIKGAHGPIRKTGLEKLLSNATMYKKVAALRRIYRMFVATGVCTNGNPFDTDKIKNPPKNSGRKRPTEMVPFDQVRNVIEQAGESTAKGCQDKAILACLFGGGLRRSEIITLRIADVGRTPNGTVFLYLRATKSGKDARQALPAWCAILVQQHLAARLKQRALGGDPLFCSFRGKGGASCTERPLSNSGVYKLFKSCCRKAGLPSCYSPHSARATAITRLLDEGIPHRQVQEFSRHSSIQMVELYDKRRISVDENPAKLLDYESRPARNRNR